MRTNSRKARLMSYDKVITANKKLFKSGAVITRQQLVELFNISGIIDEGSYNDVQRANLTLVKAQQDINQLMRSNGLYLKSQDYYSYFMVCTRDATKATIARYVGQAQMALCNEIQLETGFVTRVSAGTWGTYNKVYNPSGTLRKNQTESEYTGTQKQVLLDFLKKV